MPRTRKNQRYVLFWIKSSRGTDGKAIFEIPANWGKKDIRSALEKWCSGFGAWDHGDNAISYGWRSIKVLDKKELNRKYDLVCKSKDRITEKWKILAAMHNVRQFSFL